MRNVFVLLVVGLISGCASVQNRVPESAIDSDNVIYVSDVQFIPCSILESGNKQDIIESLIDVQSQSNQVSAKAFIPPEVLTPLIEGLISGFNSASGSYFNYRQTTAIINREWLIRGVTNSSDVKDIITIIKDSVDGSIIP